MNPDEILTPFEPGEPKRIAPTDVAQYIRLDQCHRYLRLRVSERTRRVDFMRGYGVSPQDPPPLMMLGGSEFEASVCAQIAGARNTKHLRDIAPGGKNDVAFILDAMGALQPGESTILFQPRLQATVDEWQMTGDVDLLRLTRGSDGALRALIVDIKSSQASKVEHRLQVAFYARMLAAAAVSNLRPTHIDLGVLFRGSADPLEPDALAQRDAAITELGTDLGLLELIDDPQPYLSAVDDLVAGEVSAANRVLATPFPDVPFHLTYRCDWCRYNPFCMKWAAERDDLSLVPYLSETDKTALRRAGVRTASALSEIKTDGADDRLVVAPEHADLAAKLATTWPIGARLDELVSRARRYRGWKGDPVKAGNFLPHRGYGTLPYADAVQNPNVIRIFLDAQHDNQNDRIYLIGSLVTAASGGIVSDARRRSIVVCTDSPPDSDDAERRLLLDWIEQTIRAVVELADPDANGEARAPIHLIFFNRFDQELFLNALARHAASIFAATPLYDFFTQLAAFDSPVATFLVDEIRELRNYPMLSQSLQSVARFRRFDWNTPKPFTRLFHERLFDYTGKFDDGDPTAPGGSPWYTSRSRFNSQIPLEYAYAAFGALPEPVPGARDDFAPYRAVTQDDLIAFQARRLEALEFVAYDFQGNRQTSKTTFTLPDLDRFEDRAQSLAEAIQEFVTIERHVELSAWKHGKLMPPERRVLAGESLIVEYLAEDQATGVAAKLREAARRRQLEEQFRAEYRAANPDAKRIQLPKEQKDACAWSIDGIDVRFRISADDLDCSLQEALDLNGFGSGESLVISPRTTVDERLPEAERVPFTPTAKQLLYATRGRLQRIEVEYGDDGTAIGASAHVELQHRSGGTLPGGFVFGSNTRPPVDGEKLVLDQDPNDWSGYYANKVAEGLVAGGANSLYDVLAGHEETPVESSRTAANAQSRFVEGLTELARRGQFHAFEPSKRAYVGEHGGDRLLLVQGPPGTGKSFTTAFALFARMQGALAADLDFRVVVSCHTHAAIDVLMRNLAQARNDLELIHIRYPDLFTKYFDERLLDVPLFRYRGTKPSASGVVDLRRKKDLGSGETVAVDRFATHRWAVLGATPGGIFGLIDERWKNEVFDHKFADCLVLDEASQLSLPTAMMCALPLRADGRFIVVGDHRQMPPIVKHDWSGERRRTFSEFKAFESLFLTILARDPKPPLIQFAESFRLHGEMAEFLRANIYRQDDIAFHSNRTWALAPRSIADPFVAATLDPDFPLVVVVHDEAASQHNNDVERDLIASIARELTDETIYGDEEADGFGIVVPHRAQRAAMSTLLTSFPDRVGNKPVLADTVERFQGDEREVIIVSATESDPAYLLASSGFLIEPRRLTVALSRAKRKLILVASQSVFDLFSPDEETFAHAQIWKNLLHRTCTVPIWVGERSGQFVQVWGNHPTNPKD